MTNEQIAGDADQFPEDEHHQKIVRQDDPEHREREQAQAREVARERAVLAHVTPGKNVDGAADAGDDEHHQQTERVEPQPEVHLQIADLQPGHERFLLQWLPAVGGDENDA